MQPRLRPLFDAANFVVIISFLTEFNKYFKETSKHGISI